jgi:hypothetical protein
MIAKTFEIRDRATFIPVMAVRLQPGNEADRYLLARAGYGTTPTRQAEYVQLFRLAGGEGDSNCDPNVWGGRTMPVAHQFIIDNFDALESGAVVDVQHVLAETDHPAVSERVTSPF